jgi:hypothetical protein
VEVMFDLRKANRKRVEGRGGYGSVNRLFHRVTSTYVRARGRDEQLYLDELSKLLRVQVHAQTLRLVSRGTITRQDHAQVWKSVQEL